MRVFYLLQIQRKIIKLANKGTVYKVTFNFLELLFVVLYSVHFCSCVQISVGKKNPDNSWLDDSILERDNNYDVYLTAFYYSAITMSTIGYGDIVPRNTQERFLNVFVAKFGYGMFAYGINEVKNIFDQINAAGKRKFQENLVMIKYLQNKEISSKTQDRAKRYMDYIYRKNIEEIAAGMALIGKLPRSLANEISAESNLKLLRRQPFVTNNFSQEFITALAGAMVEQNYGPETTVIEQGQTVDFMYFIRQGTVSVCLGNVVIDRAARTNFGLLEFLRDKISDVTVQSSGGNLSIIKIDKQRFFDLIGQFVDDYHAFCMLRDELLCCSGFTYQPCKICSSIRHHSANNCNFVHLTVNRIRLLDQKSVEAQRQKLARRIVDKRSAQKTWTKVAQTSAIKRSIIKDIASDSDCAAKTSKMAARDEERSSGGRGESSGGREGREEHELEAEVGAERPNREREKNSSRNESVNER